MIQNRRNGTGRTTCAAMIRIALTMQFRPLGCLSPDRDAIAAGRPRDAEIAGYAKGEVL